MIEKISYFILENTSWSNSQSWFGEHGYKRYATYEEAEARYQYVKTHKPDPSILWRITKVTTEYEYTELHH
jgi:hypothetical protein